ncbi:hypothetical protein IG631_24286 [Alternaria alternata]|nr:hypothetical protein IG631_24286 [Alternaria alternata]
MSRTTSGLQPRDQSIHLQLHFACPCSGPTTCLPCVLFQSDRLRTAQHRSAGDPLLNCRHRSHLPYGRPMIEWTAVSSSSFVPGDVGRSRNGAAMGIGAYHRGRRKCCSTQG